MSGYDKIMVLLGVIFIERNGKWAAPTFLRIMGKDVENCQG
jgi:hypothetical protein